MSNEFKWDEKAVKNFMYYSKGAGWDIGWSETETDELISSFEQKEKSKQVFNKDYEILEFDITWMGYIPPDMKDYKYSTKLLLEKGCPIKKVKRLSDNEVFTVGDKTTYGVIEKFTMEGNWGINAHFTNGSGATLRSLEKAKERKPLFTTEENIPVHEGDNYYVVEKHFEIGHGVGGDGYNESGHVLKIFYTPDKAKEYILMNKPCLSLNEVNNIYEGDKPFDFLLKLSELAKSKTNA